MVIMSNGIPRSPIIPKIKKAAIKLGTTPIKDNFIFLNKTINIEKIPIITNPKVKIWDLNKLCSKLLNRIKTPASLNSFSFNPILFLRSKFILFIKSFLLKFSWESIILKLIRASLFSIDKYGSIISVLILSGILEYKTPISKVPKGLLLFNWVATSIIDEKDKTLPTCGRLSK